MMTSEQLVRVLRIALRRELLAEIRTAESLRPFLLERYQGFHEPQVKNARILEKELVGRVLEAGPLVDRARAILQELEVEPKLAKSVLLEIFNEKDLGLP